MSKTGKIKPQIPKEFLMYGAAVLGIALVFTGLIFLFDINFKIIALLAGLILAGAVSLLPQKLAPVSIGIELVSLGAVTAGILYGPLAGALVGVTASALSGFYALDRPQDTVAMIIGFAIMGALAPFIYNAYGLGLTAILLTVIYDVITGVFYAFTGYSWSSVARFALVHIPVNYILITWLVPKLFAI